MTDQRQPRKKRKIAWCVTLIVLVGVVWFGTFRWSVSRRLAKQIAALESQGYPVTLDQLNDWYQLPDGADNAADYYMEAFACRVDWNSAAAKPLPFVGSASWPEPNVPFDPNTLYQADQGVYCVFRGRRWPGQWRTRKGLQGSKQTI